MPEFNRFFAKSLRPRITDVCLSRFFGVRAGQARSQRLHFVSLLKSVGSGKLPYYNYFVFITKYHNKSHRLLGGMFVMVLPY